MSNIDELNLWYEQQLVGYLWRNDLDRIGFRYDDFWLRNESCFPISLQLPLRKAEFLPDEGVAHRFFANLLPEGQARTNIVNSLKITDSDFALLKAIGGECAGAFNILPYTSEPLSATEWKYKTLSEEELQTLINRQGQIYSFANNEGLPLRLSLAGAQNKCAVLIKEDAFFLPENEAPTSHILKFQIAGFNHVPAYETVLMKLAQSLGLPVAEIELRALGGLPADNPEHSFVVIKRYDRVRDDVGNIRRLHQEDFCQALGVGYEKKYQFDGGPAFSDCLNLIKEKSDEPVTDMELLLKWQIFNLLVGNSDGHAKNISLLYSEDNSLRLAPFYDLVCTRAIEHIDAKLAFSIGGQYEPGQIDQKDWSAFAKDNDINQRFLFNLINEQAEQIQDTLPVVLQKFRDDYGAYGALQRVERVINNQCKRTLKNIN